MTTVVLALWLREATTALASVADQPRMEARRLVAFVCGWDAGQQIADPDRPLSPHQQAQLAHALQRRLDDEPLSRILGRREFWGLDLSIDGATLDPRADTETLVDLVLETYAADAAAPSRILDLGTGSGAILLALLSAYPRATGLGIDQSAATVETARGNARDLGLNARARFEVGDWLNGVQGRFDLIVSNPPYVPTGDLPQLARNVREFDDPAALDGGADGLVFYRRTLTEAAAVLEPGGVLAVEIGIDQRDAVAEAASGLGWTISGQRADLAGIPRALTMVRLA